ncbi:MAG: ABC transporter ATP-binding protein [Betaproteobacteria bacterium]|nr:ABC transporter ATP-binding protein [Betaproteobacteria bacterium]
MLVELRNLRKHFTLGGGLSFRRGTVFAVDGVSFGIAAGETFALVGESGCGKTTIAKMVLMLERPSSGAVHFGGIDLQAMSGAETRSYRRQVQAVFQDPFASLNPRLRVKTIIAEPILTQERVERAVLRRRIEELLDIVGLPAGAADLFPHEFSGGQRQRIAIARALAPNPRFIVLDEPISALDVSIRAQILNLLADIQQRFGLTYLVIAHDLALVEHFSDRVGVMYLGNLVESGPTAEVFAQPRHPYTQALLASVLRPDPDHRPRVDAIRGEIASAMSPPSGCKFHPRCPHALEHCAVEAPAWRDLGGGCAAACHLLETSHAQSA